MAASKVQGCCRSGCSGTCQGRAGGLQGALQGPEVPLARCQVHSVFYTLFDSSLHESIIYVCMYAFVCLWTSSLFFWKLVCWMMMIHRFNTTSLIFKLCYFSNFVFLITFSPSYASLCGLIQLWLLCISALLFSFSWDLNDIEFQLCTH